MKKYLLLFLGVIFSIMTWSQSKNSFKYQAVIRDNQGSVISEESVSMRISILQGTETGVSVYTEEHNITSNSMGMIFLNIGEGNVASGNFNSIEWGADNYFLMIELSRAEAEYITMGISQLLSVPYAIHAQTVSNADDADADPINEIQTLTIEGNTITLSGGGSIILPNSAGFSGDYNALTNKPSLSGDVSGELNATSVEKIQGKSVSTNSPSDGQVLKWDAETSSWIPGQDELGAAGTTDGVAESIGVTGTTAKTITVSRSNSLPSLTATFSDNINDADADSTNELQNIIIENDSIKISNGQGAPLPNGLNLWQSDGNNVYLPTGNVGMGSVTPSGKLEVKGNPIDTPNDILFSVLNNAGDTIFAVFQGGVRIVVDNSPVKGARGGFAVAGVSSGGKGSGPDFLTVTPDSVRVYIDTSTTSKGTRGGFAVAGVSSGGKGVGVDILNVSKEKTQIFVNDPLAGFQVMNTGNGIDQQLLKLTEENYFIGHDIAPNLTSGTKNSVFGYLAGNSLQGGKNNVFIGSEAGKSMTSGHENIFIGNYAGYSSVGPVRNVFIGDSAGRSNVIGQYNVYMGSDAGKKGTGYNNVILGGLAASTSDFGNSNVAIGYVAGRDMVSTRNVFIGQGAGYNHTGTVGGNVFIGYYAGEQYPTTGNTLAIGGAARTTPLIYGEFDNSIVTINGKLGVGRSPVLNALEVQGTASNTTATAWAANSDRRIKTDILDIENSFQTILKLRPVKFKYTEEWKERNPSIKDQYYYNFIAQEYKEVFPNSVQGSGEFIEGDPNEILQMDSYNAQIVAIKAVQELIEENKMQQVKIDKLEQEIKEIKLLLMQK